MSPRGVIAAGHRLTADAGADVLRAGGNAVDAAIAAVAMACVCEPVLCSPGGGAFAVVRSADGSVRVFDAFVHTPLRRSAGLRDGVHDVDADFGTTRQAFRIGPATTAVPGLFDGLARLAATFGSTPLDVLVAAAAHAARNGIVITPFQHHLSTVVAPILLATESARSLFAPDGRLLPAGSRFTNPALADALELLARDGFAASDAAAAALAQQDGRGHVRSADLAAYEVIERRPHEVEVAGARVFLNPLPAAGGVLVGHTLARLAGATPLDLATAIAATGTALDDAAGDLRVLAALPQRARGTTHVSVVDADGLACSITVSNGEGNGELVDGFGFMLNNMLGEDDVNPDGDVWPVDTRLSSMMCPTIIEHPDGGLTALGSGGSSRIRSAISRVVAALCLDSADLATAVHAPRVHVTGDHLDVERHAATQHPEGAAVDDVLDDTGPHELLDDATLDGLRRHFARHLVWPGPDMYFGGVHAARRSPDGALVGVGDPRRGGAATVVVAAPPAV